MCYSWANSPYFILALPIVAMFGITAWAFETLIPSENEIKVVSSVCLFVSFMSCYVFLLSYGLHSVSNIRMPYVHFV